MLNPRVWLVVLSVLVLLLAPGAKAGAQRQSSREALRLSGTIQGVRPGYLQVIGANDEVWVLQVQARPRDVEYRGLAEPTWLRPGMLVRFTASFNERGQSDQPLQQFTVVTLREGMRVGVFKETVLDTEGLFSSEKEISQPAEAEYAPYLVLGRLAGFKNGKMQVAAGRTPVQIELAEDPQISVEVADYSIARPGDKIEVQGWYPMGQKGRGVVEKLTITSEQPLTAPQKPARGRRAERAEKEEKEEKEE